VDELLDAFAWLADRDNWRGNNGVLNLLLEHLWLTAVSVAIGCAIAIPVGLWLGHIGRGGTLAINISNIGRAVPVFAALVMLFLLLGAARRTEATVIALVLFAIPPILTNTYVGMRDVDRDAVDAARGMGMSGVQVLRRVELPLSVALVMNGVRLAAVQVVATATIAALVAAGGLGRIITAGFAVQDYARMIAGAILVAALALAVEGALELLQRRVDPLRRAGRGNVRQRADVVAVTEP
jgi:osmoprotectant transport system permease protein